MLPFLKDRHDGEPSGHSDVEIRDSDYTDDDDAYSMIDVIAEEIIEAIHQRDKRLMKEALNALIHHIQHRDTIQDEEEMR